MTRCVLCLTLLVAAVCCGTAENNAEDAAVAQGPVASPPGSGAADESIDSRAEPVVGGTRLRALVVRGTDGSSFTEPTTFYDSALQVNCSVATATDGAKRCLPSLVARQLASFAVLYADAQCKLPAVALDCDQTAPQYFAVLPQGAAACADVPRPVYAAGPRAADNNVYGLDDSGACLPHSSASLGEGPYYFQVGALVPPSSFVQFH